MGCALLYSRPGSDNSCRSPDRDLEVVTVPPCVYIESQTHCGQASLTFLPRPEILPRWRWMPLERKIPLARMRSAVDSADTGVKPSLPPRQAYCHYLQRRQR